VTIDGAQHTRDSRILASPAEDSMIKARTSKVPAIACRVR
jgi:hypothetical protein